MSLTAYKKLLLLRWLGSSIVEQSHRIRKCARCEPPAMTSLQTVQLRDVDLLSLKLVKKTYAQIDGRDHSRWVFCTRNDPKEILYFKIWNPSYVRQSHLRKGIESGFYDEITTPALQALICSNGVCRGYIMRKCVPNRDKDPRFDRAILDRTVRTGYFAVQYSRFHTMRYGTQYSLVDLEGIHPLTELPKLETYYNAYFDDPEYESFVVDLYCRTFPHHRPSQLIGPRPKSKVHRLITYPVRKTKSITQHLHMSYFGAPRTEISRIE
jgi:hypothetical protein